MHHTTRFEPEHLQSCFLTACVPARVQMDNPSPRVLVHCSAGISRSSAVVVSYLMRKLSLSLSDSLSRVRDKHPAAAPNAGFIAQLMALETELGVGNAASNRLEACEMMSVAYSPVSGRPGALSQRICSLQACSRSRRRDTWYKSTCKNVHITICAYLSACWQTTWRRRASVLGRATSLTAG